MSDLSHFNSNSNPLFKIDTVGIHTNLGSSIDNIQVFNRTILKPINNNPVNVYGDFDWKNRSDVDEVPVVILREKTLAMGGLARTLANIYKKGAEVAGGYEAGGLAGLVAEISDPYANMYITENTTDNFIYHLPWLLNNGSNLRKITNSWKDETGKPLSSGGSGGESKSGLASVLGTLGGVVAGAMSPGFGVEKIQSFDQTANMSLNITFPLYNTVSVESTFRNYCFVNLFSYQNLKNRTSLISYVPPCVYEVESYGGGGVYMPMACVENLSIENMGTVRLMKEFTEYVGDTPLLIPEAYMVSITLKEMIPQSANIFAATMGAKKVKVSSPMGGGNARANEQEGAVPVGFGNLRK
jgi:hypothetical protein